jgi:butyryl-CoA dehydrogenase
MAMTEPHAGSSLSDLQSTALRTAEDYFLLSGQKIFISCGEHDGADNIVHLMLARIEGAPAGVKGISLFVVPKLRPDGHGGLVPNDVACTGIFHKLGYRGSPITQLEMGEQGDCRAWLVGEEHQGLRYMFQMMNEARVGVGMGATAIATAAYYASLKYTMERCQGRPIAGKDLSAPQIPIIEHADVKRMLLFQRAIVEGSFSLIVYCSKLIDLIHAGPVEERERYELLLDFLTPIAKSYPSEMGIISVSPGLQCLGGYGYCDEFPLEQYYRDARIHPIHEGTTGIQGLDLLGRKVTMRNGAAYRAFIAAVEAALADAGELEALSEARTALGEAVALLDEVTEALLKAAASGETEAFLADATLYLEMTSLVAIGWHWLLQGTVAERALTTAPDSPDRHFYLGKRDAYTYFMRYELPKTQGLATRLKQCDGFTARVDVRNFEGA